MTLAQRAGVTLAKFINEGIIATDYERAYVSKQSDKQQEMYKVRKFVHLHDSIFEGTHEDGLAALNLFCLKQGYKPRKNKTSVTKILQEPRRFHEFPDLHE
ncbi:hypothetical protein [Priestia megaterium]|uniref:hypothetical protein n=1 Tax=Priestia megaterium TaxID=1404 RepID=UPI0039E96CEB